jgi:hypothetical protein
MPRIPEKSLKKDTFEEKIPNETTIKALGETEFFSADSAEEMITDCLDGDESWKNTRQK